MKSITPVFFLLLAIAFTNGEQGINPDEPPTPPPEPQIEVNHEADSALSQEEHRKVEVILEERHDRDSLGINYEHIRSYSFNLKHTDEFILAVEFDHKIKGAANAYMEVDNSYIEMSYKEGEQTRLVIFEDMRTVVYNKQFYHATGFDFEAKKGREYLFRYIKEGTNKLIIMYLENFMAEGKTEANLLTDVATDHQRRTNEVKNKLMTFLGYTEQTALLNERISKTVQEHTQLYMHYQVLETLLVLAITVSQVYFIRRLLTKSSVV